MKSYSPEYSQYHLAVAGGCAAKKFNRQTGFAPTRYREVVLTAFNDQFLLASFPNPIT